MLSLKKYFTEGLIQFTILLSLVGVRVDVDSYLSSRLPPLREIILGPSSAYAQAQFHHARGASEGYGLHPKSAELDAYLASRRLLGRVRALGRLRVPSAQVSAWLVHRDAEGAVSGGPPAPGAALQDGAAPDARDGAAEQGFGGEEPEDLGAVAAPAGGDLTKEHPESGRGAGGGRE
ncbi:endoplasmic reticulum membrane sensor NFE2L1 [Hirundo rustica]|uniref:endoplasmic reticulum membrane sensor NFE2L1 n=1 Tax=Hirundo rustica TaxID=43150 RepID=UPI001A93F9F8|nr:endoplasmic reticulum membrane sensor NFE2L1 [Hirundo rustica]